MKVLICGEGNHDIGSKEWDSRRRDWVTNEGWMQPLVRKILSKDCEIEVARRKEIVLLPRDAKSHKPLPPGHGAKALASLYFAKKADCKIVIFMTDCDSPEEKVWRNKRDEIIAGFEAVATETSALPCVPRSMSECWLLADVSAWLAVSECEVASTPELEELWGERHEPTSDHPKHKFTRICDSADLPDNRDTREKLADAADISVIQSACPTSFGDFRTRLEHCSFESGL